MCGPGCSPGTPSQTYGRLLALILALYSPTVLFSRVVRVGQKHRSSTGSASGGASPRPGAAAPKKKAEGCDVCYCCYRDRREARAELKQRRERMRNSGSSTEELAAEGSDEAVFPLADTLVIHMHGGGFVAQSSASHETYVLPNLRQAAHTDPCALLTYRGIAGSTGT